MEELIFIALIFFFSIIESIARKRKKTGTGSPELPGEWEPVEDESWRQKRTQEDDPRMGRRPGALGQARGGLPAGAQRRGSTPTMYDTYDAEPSYDDEATEQAAGSREGLPGRARPSGAGSEVRRAQPTSSEGMIRADLWKELEKLSRGTGVQVPAPKPKPAPRLPVPTSRPQPTPAQRTPALARPTAVPRRAEGHRIHEAHAGYGTDPSERPPSPHDRIDPFARTLSADAAAVHRQLQGHDRHALRQAMILQEVLGPPVALRPDPFSE
jgi:hypothetical protein